MRLDRVTITGADDHTSVEEMLELSELFPFVEWGILAHKSNADHERFPSDEWMALALSVAPWLGRLSLHLCGRWVRQLLLGVNELPFCRVPPGFQRVQLNFHAERTECNPRLFWKALHAIDERGPPRQWIFQVDGAGSNKHLEAVHSENDPEFVDAVALFDMSGGSGLTPAKWPQPVYIEAVDPETEREQFAYHGYAGGLGPDNIEAELKRIGEAAGNTRIWIDMENNVRTDGKLDMAKVRRVLEVCAPLIWKKL